MTEAADGPSQPTSYGGPAGASVAATTRCVRWRRAGTRTRSGRSTSATTRRCIGIAARQTGAWEGLEEDRAVGGQPRCPALPQRRGGRERQEQREVGAP